jgi:hypothetical protein
MVSSEEMDMETETLEGPKTMVSSPNNPDTIRMRVQVYFVAENEGTAKVDILRIGKLVRTKSDL